MIKTNGGRKIDLWCGLFVFRRKRENEKTKAVSAMETAFVIYKNA